MGKRHTIIGIKQVIRLEWMKKTVNLLLSGMDEQQIRRELHEFLSDKRGSGEASIRGETSRSQIVNMLMTIWVTPPSHLTPMRDDAVRFIRANQAMDLAVHWGMISAVYPFWYQTACQTGRLLALQKKVSQSQILTRLKEQYGDKQTISRYGRSVIRSFVAWGVLKDSEEKGCYEKAASLSIEKSDLAVIMLEAALHVNPDAHRTLNLLLNSPGFFPFHLPVMNGDFIANNCQRIDMIRNYEDTVTLFLKSR